MKNTVKRIKNIKNIKNVIKRRTVPESPVESDTVVRKPGDLKHLRRGNSVIGALPELNDSTIVFSGENNILFCEPGVVLSGSSILFNKDNSLIYLSAGRHPYQLSVSINNDCVCYFGKNNYFNNVLHIILSEHKHFFAGDHCLFSLDICIRNADPHLIYDEKTGERLNQTKSIFIGDHVWIGQSAMILKGTKIDSGSIIGGMSVVSGTIDHNSIWAGNPARKLHDSIFWDETCVHKWKQEDTDRSRFFTNIMDPDTMAYDDYIFKYDESETVPYESIDEAFDGDDPERKLDYIKQLNKKVNKNRFVH